MEVDGKMFASRAPKSNVTTMLVIIAAVLAAFGGLTWFFTRP